MSQVDPFSEFPHGDGSGPQGNGSNGDSALGGSAGESALGGAAGNGSPGGVGSNGAGGYNAGVLSTLDGHHNGLPSLAWNNGLPMRPEILTAKPNPAVLAHAVRRRWPLAIGLGTLTAFLLAGLVWYFVPVHYEVFALIRVAARAPKVLKEGGDAHEQFDLYKRTQEELIRSNLVVFAVTRDPSIIKLRTIQDHSEDTAQWLRDNLIIDNPGNSEILRVALRGGRPADLKAIVDKVVEKYIQEVVFRERDERIRNAAKLSETYDKYAEDYRTQYQTLKTMEKQAQVASSDAVQVAKAQLNTQFMNAMMRIEKLTSDLDETKRKLILAQRRRDNPEAMRPPDFAIEQHVNQDPIVVGYTQDIWRLNEALMSERQSLANKKNKENRNTKAIEKALGVKSQMLEERKAELTAALIEGYADVAGGGGASSIAELEAEVETMQQQQTEAEDEVEKVAEKLRSFETNNANVVSKQEEVLSTQKTMNALKEEINLLKLEQQAAERITKLDDATLSNPYGDSIRKYIGMGFAAIAGFMGVVLAIGFVEFQSRRVNATREVSDGLGLRVVGELPNLSTHMLKRIKGGNSAAVLKALISERIDGARAALVHTTAIRPPKVVMVTSAESLEGKTTTATQLAASLARSGRRTLLVDADIRNGSCHRVFDLAAEPGLCELLRGEVDRDAIVQPTRTTNLWLAPAGHCDLRSVQALSSPAMASAFAAFASQFDYVVVDAGPVLKVADPLLVGQHVDAAIVSVLRDVSKMPRVYEACERLRAVGITVLGSVVCGVNDDVARHGVELLLAEAANG